MIIGNGLLGNCFTNNLSNHEKYIIFASGVSNSKETNVIKFKREKDLILKTLKHNTNLKFIYFSSILTGVSNNEYYNHKLDIEKIIKTESNNYIIFRIPQVIGESGNGNNLVNFLKNSIINNSEITIYENIKRSLIDVVDVVNIVNYCKDKVSCETIYVSDIEKIDVIDLVNKISFKLNKTPIIKIDNNVSDNNWIIENSVIVDESIINIGIKKIGYTDTIINKYIK